MHVFYSPFPIYTSKYWPSWKRWKRNHFKRKLNDTFDWKYFFLYSTILNSFVKRNLFFLSYWLSIWILGVWCAMLWWCLPFVPLGCIQSIFFIFFNYFSIVFTLAPPNYRLLLPFAGNDVDVVVTQQLSRTETSLYLWQLHMGAIGVPLSVSFDASLVPFCFVFSNLLAASPLQQKLAFNSIF